MYAMWSSLGKEKDPFVIIPAFPIKDEFKDSWSKTRIRKEIFDAETGDIMQVIIVKLRLGSGTQALSGSLRLKLRLSDSGSVTE